MCLSTTPFILNTSASSRMVGMTGAVILKQTSQTSVGSIDNSSRDMTVVLFSTEAEDR